jgi:hypothetical protein
MRQFARLRRQARRQPTWLYPVVKFMEATMRVLRSIPSGLVLIAVYVVVALVFETVAFAASWMVTQFNESVGLMVFVGSFIAALYVAWPIAVRIFDRTGWDNASKSLLLACAFVMGGAAEEAFAQAYDEERHRIPVYALSHG